MSKLSKIINLKDLCLLGILIIGIIYRSDSISLYLLLCLVIGIGTKLFDLSKILEQYMYLLIILIVSLILHPLFLILILLYNIKLKRIDYILLIIPSLLMIYFRLTIPETIIYILILMINQQTQIIFLKFDEKLETLKNDFKKQKYLLKESALIDSLSGLYHNAYIYNYLDDYITEDIALCSLSIIMLDLNNLRRINDQYGHLFGDVVIRRIANELKAATTSKDVIGRYSGEEFIVVLNDTTTTDTVSIADTIKQNILNLKFEHEIELPICMGIAFYNGESGKELLSKADMQLHQAKQLRKRNN